MHWLDTVVVIRLVQEIDSRIPPGTGEMSQQSRVLAVLKEDQSLVPSTTSGPGSPQLPVTSMPIDAMSSSGLHRHPHPCGRHTPSLTHIYAQTDMKSL